MREEMLDIIDEETGAPIGVAARGEVHRLGHWHQTFHCWIYTVREGGIELLFQKRHPEKDTCPNLLDITSAGHLAAAEGPADGVRELEEELGIKIPFAALQSVGVIKDVMVSPGICDKELCHVYACASDRPLHDYRLQPEEVTGLFWVRLDELERLFAGELSRITAEGFLSEADGTKKDVVLEVAQAAFVPHEWHYYRRVFAAVRRLASGSA